MALEIDLSGRVVLVTGGSRGLTEQRDLAARSLDHDAGKLDRRSNHHVRLEVDFLDRSVGSARDERARACDDQRAIGDEFDDLGRAASFGHAFWRGSRTAWPMIS